MFKLIFSFFLILLPFQSFSYIGPGMAGGLIISIIGIILAILIALLGILFFPIKRFINKYIKKK
ncbi:MAG: hypothetical protein ACJ0GH_05140 [Alphaproteobacteria bacterium]|mgnify:CR=1 FL=1